MSHKIKSIIDDWVTVDPPVKGSIRIKKEKFGITDPAIALLVDNEFEQGIPTNFITRFEPGLARDLGTPTPAVDRNPYNFVAFAADKPWLFAAGASKADPNKYWGHDTFRDFSGTIEFTATARTPCFVPEGFPFQESDGYTADELRRIPRRFFRMLNSEDEQHYAIPGASFKGALRNAIEAIANTRLGVVDDKVFDEFAHLYRRRVFRVGRLTVQLPNQDWTVEEFRPNLDGGGSIDVDNLQGLLAALPKGKPTDKYLDPAHNTFTLTAALAEAYRKNAEHPHYDRHWKTEEEKAAKKPPENFYAAKFSASNFNAALRTLAAGDIIYFTVDGRKIVNFGKNVNYLWPAKKSLRDLAVSFLPRKERPRLDSQIDLADFLFGFAGDHTRDPAEPKKFLSHPFQGHLRFETLWGPIVEDDERQCVKLNLAALTSPSSKGKSRPLYLDPPADGVSSSFDELNARLRGRKFYWSQRTEDGAIWIKHRFEGMPGSQDAELRKGIHSQCPPPIRALPQETSFIGRIHFSSLNAQALGSVLFALQGDDSFDHTFHLGKGKPRGLGSFKITVTKLLRDDNAARYSSLTQTKGVHDLTGKAQAIVNVFAAWSAIQAKLDPKSTPLSKHPHIQDYIQLHTWPAQNSVRTYPINFNQYSWLPADNDPDGEPRTVQNRNPSRQNRPLSMKRARNLKP